MLSNLLHDFIVFCIAIMTFLIYAYARYVLGTQHLSWSIVIVRSPAYSGSKSISQRTVSLRVSASIRSTTAVLAYDKNVAAKGCPKRF